VTEPTPEGLRKRIAAERAELGRTASVLADRVDVGSRARAAREQATERTRAGVVAATERARTGVVAATGQVKTGVGQAQEVGREVFGRTAVTAKQAVGTVGSALHGRDPKPVLAAGAGAAVLALLLVVLRRRRR
jgi:hypothetical protein